MQTRVVENPLAKQRRWPGILVSLLVPGFGLVRAGRPLRGLAWFTLQFFAGTVIVFLVIARSIPTWIVCAAFFFQLALTLTMLADSFRPGKMSWPFALLFVGLLLLLLKVPLPSDWIRAFKMPTSSMEPP